MNNGSGIRKRVGVATAAALLHAFLLVFSIVSVQADPLFNTYENVTEMALADQAPDESAEKKSPDGDDLSLWSLARRDQVSLRLAERRCYIQDAPRVSGCGRSFHARGPPGSSA